MYKHSRPVPCYHINHHYKQILEWNLDNHYESNLAWQQSLVIVQKITLPSHTSMIMYITTLDKIIIHKPLRVYFDHHKILPLGLKSVINYYTSLYLTKFFINNKGWHSSYQNVMQKWIMTKLKKIYYLTSKYNLMKCKLKRVNPQDQKLYNIYQGKSYQWYKGNIQQGISGYINILDRCKTSGVSLSVCVKCIHIYTYQIQDVQ